MKTSRSQILSLSRFGEIATINLVRDKKTGKSKGFAFLSYEDDRSAILAVDNFNGAELLGRTLRVDHVRDYKESEEKIERLVDLEKMKNDQVWTRDAENDAREEGANKQERRKSKDLRSSRSSGEGGREDEGTKRKRRRSEEEGRKSRKHSSR